MNEKDLPEFTVAELTKELLTILDKSIVEFDTQQSIQGDLQIAEQLDETVKPLLYELRSYIELNQILSEECSKIFNQIRRKMVAICDRKPNLEIFPAIIRRLEAQFIQMQTEINNATSEL